MAKEYKVIVGINTQMSGFEKQITEHLNDGWRCQGGVSMAYYTGKDDDGDTTYTATYAQAMIRDIAD